MIRRIFRRRRGSSCAAGGWIWSALTAPWGFWGRSDPYGLEWDVRTKERLEAMGCVHDNTVFILNHFSHNCGHGLSHEEMEALAAPKGFLVACDGFTAEV